MHNKVGEDNKLSEIQLKMRNFGVSVSNQLWDNNIRYNFYRISIWKQHHLNIINPLL